MTARLYALLLAAAACGGSHAAAPTTTPTPQPTPTPSHPGIATPPTSPEASDARRELLALVAAAHEGRATLSADRLLSAFTTTEDLVSIGVEPSPPLRGRKAFETAVRGGFASGLRSARRVANHNEAWASADGQFAGLYSELVEEGDAEYRNADGKTGIVQYHLPLRLTAFARREADGKLRIVLWRLTASLPLSRLGPTIADEIAAARPGPGLEENRGTQPDPPPLSRALSALETLESAGTADGLDAALTPEVTLLGPEPGAPRERAAWIRLRAAAAVRGRAVNFIDEGGVADAHGGWVFLDLVVTEPTKPPLFLRVTAVVLPDPAGHFRVQLIDEGVPVPAATAVELVNP